MVAILLGQSLPRNCYANTKFYPQTARIKDHWAQHSTLAVAGFVAHLVSGADFAIQTAEDVGASIAYY